MFDKVGNIRRQARVCSGCDGTGKEKKTKYLRYIPTCMHCDGFGEVFEKTFIEGEQVDG